MSTLHSANAELKYNASNPMQTQTYVPFPTLPLPFEIQLASEFRKAS